MLALLQSQEAERDWSHLSGSISTKLVKGIEYVYFQYSDPGGAKRQFSIGRRDAALDAVIERYGQGREDREADRAQLQRLAGLLRSPGLALLPHRPARVVRALAYAGVFRAGGVLVGSYAFRVRGKPLPVDLITPGTDADAGPIFIPRFQAAAAPIKHLSLLIEDAQPAAAVDGRTATLVLVPTPAGFALHKLYVSQTRALSQQTKGGKDLHQAALLIEALAEDRPKDLVDVARAFVAAGPAVSSKLLRALGVAVNSWPGAQAGAETVAMSQRPVCQDTSRRTP